MIYQPKKNVHVFKKSVTPKTVESLKKFFGIGKIESITSLKSATPSPLPPTGKIKVKTLETPSNLEQERKKEENKKNMEGLVISIGGKLLTMAGESGGGEGGYSVNKISKIKNTVTQRKKI